MVQDGGYGSVPRQSRAGCHTFIDKSNPLLYARSCRSQAKSHGSDYSLFAENLINSPLINVLAIAYKLLTPLHAAGLNKHVVQ